MPIFLLTEKLIFPDPRLATKEGILAIGGDLSTERLLLAYQSGIFPWYSEPDPILWWSPDPRFVIFPNEFHLSKRDMRYYKKTSLIFKIDTAFEKVIHFCRKQNRKGQNGTWITSEMQAAYIRLHYEGYAHSIEAWENDRLVGGLYGVSIGKCFFGESMFTLQPNASKLALFYLMQKLQKLGFVLFDSQVQTPHIARWGGKNISREQYLSLLKQGCEEEGYYGNWSNLVEFQ